MQFQWLKPRIEVRLHLIITLLGAAIFSILLVRCHEQNRLLPPPSPLPVIVDIQGSVNRPGIHLLNGPNATLSEALFAAEGLRDGNLNLINESLQNMRIETGQAIRILDNSPSGPTVEIGRMDAAARLTLGLKLDINDLSPEELCLIPSIKPEMASDIFNRGRQRPWKSLHELEEIPGIGPKTIEKLQNYLTVSSEQ